MATTKSDPINPYRTILFATALASAVAAIGLAVAAGTLRDDPAAAATAWDWVGHAVTLGIVAFVGELVIAGTMWRPPAALPPAAEGTDGA